MGFKKVEENYGETAVTVDQKIENKYCTITLETMAADSAYLIYEYYVDFTDLAMSKIGESIQYDEYEGYNVTLEKSLEINGQQIDEIASWSSMEKLTDRQFRIIYIYNIANINSNVLNISQKLKNLYVGEAFDYTLETEINREITAKITFKNNERNILAETKLQNGSTLYIEQVTSSKFADYVVARIVTEPKKYQEINNKNNEFMLEDPQFAICDENDNTINFDYKRLEEYYKKVLSDGKTVKVENNRELKATDLVQMEEVQLLRLGLDEEKIPKKLKILPLNRKLYNDRNDSEEKFYMNENWYQVKIGEINISEDSNIGGKVTINKVEETEDEIIFYYDRSGFVPSDIDFVLRIKSPKMNYAYPIKTELKNIEGIDNKIIYTKDISFLAGMPILEYEKLPNADELEFAIFYNTKYDVLSEPLEFKWNSNGNNQTGTIENIEVNEI